jgi:hypothetical protein
MLDGHETVEIACGKLRWQMRYRMLDGHQNVEKAFGKLRRDVAKEKS